MGTQSDALAGLGPQSKPVFNVVMVYEDFASGRRALETYHRLASQSQDQFEFKLKTWAVGLLRNFTLNELAARNAAEAEVIIVSFGCEDLPPAAKKWIEGWRQQKSGPHTVLAAILSCPPRAGGSPAVEDYLRNAAASSGREFLIEKTSHSRDWDVASTAAIS